MNNLIPLDFENHKIRMFDIDGSLWWVLTDICRALGISNVTQAARRLDEDERSMLNIDRQGKTIIVNEAGLNITIIRSNQAMQKGTFAYKFRRWITHEVLPSIRKYGCYPAPQASEFIDDPVYNGETTTLGQRFKQERLRWEAEVNRNSDRNYKLADIPSMSKSIITAIEHDMGGINKGKRIQMLAIADIDITYILNGRRTLTPSERIVRDAMRQGDDIKQIIYARAMLTK